MVVGYLNGFGVGGAAAQVDCLLALAAFYLKGIYIYFFGVMNAKSFILTSCILSLYGHVKSQTSSVGERLLKYFPSIFLPTYSIINN